MRAKAQSAGFSLSWLTSTIASTASTSPGAHARRKREEEEEEEERQRDLVMLLLLLPLLLDDGVAVEEERRGSGHGAWGDVGDCRLGRLLLLLLLLGRDGDSGGGGGGEEDDGLLLLLAARRGEGPLLLGLGAPNRKAGSGMGRTTRRRRRRTRASCRGHGGGLRLCRVCKCCCRGILYTTTRSQSQGRRDDADDDGGFSFGPSFSGPKVAAWSGGAGKPSSLCVVCVRVGCGQGICNMRTSQRRPPQQASCFALLRVPSSDCSTSPCLFSSNLTHTPHHTPRTGPHPNAVDNRPVKPASLAVVPALASHALASSSLSRSCIARPLLQPALSFYFSPPLLTEAAMAPAVAAATAARSSLINHGKKIIGVGKNYALHIKEMGGQAPKAPVLFLKPTTSYVFEGTPIRLHPKVGVVHHEVELALVIDKKARKVTPENALQHVGGYALAIDLTARDIQDEAKKQGLPWTVAKGQDYFCPISNMLPKAQIPDPDNVGIWLRVNDEPRQRSNTKHMVHRTDFLISYISHLFTLEPGDVILTGTPEGVGPIKVGDTVTAGIEGLMQMKFVVEADTE